MISNYPQDMNWSLIEETKNELRDLYLAGSGDLVAIVYDLKDDKKDQYFATHDGYIFREDLPKGIPIDEEYREVLLSDLIKYDNA